MPFYQFCLMAAVIWTAQANAGDKGFAKFMATLWLLSSVVAWGLDRENPKHHLHNKWQLSFLVAKPRKTKSLSESKSETKSSSTLI